MNMEDKKMKRVMYGALIIAVLVVTTLLALMVEYKGKQKSKDVTTASSNVDYKVELNNIVEKTLAENFTYDNDVDATWNLLNTQSTTGSNLKDNKEMAYSIHTKGVITPGLCVEYRPETNTMPMIVNSVKIDDKRFVNDGLMDTKDGGVVDIGAGFNRIKYLNNVWYDVIKESIDRGYDIVKDSVNDTTVYTLSTKDNEKIADIVGYSVYADENSRAIETKVNVKDGTIQSVDTTITVNRKSGTETHHQKMSNKQVLSDTIGLDKFNLTYDGVKLVPKENVKFADKPKTIGGLPFGATSVAIITQTGAIAVGVDIDGKFMSSKAKDIKQVGELQRATLNLSDTDSLNMYYNNNKLEGFDFTGGYIMYEMSSNKAYNDLDPYRIANGFTEDDILTTPTEKVYKGLIDGVEYVVGIKYDNGLDKSSGIRVMRRDSYNLEFKK